MSLLMFILATPASVGVPRGPAPIEIDGRLDEPAWATAPLNRGFVERTPNPRAAPPVDTEFRVLYDDEALYVGVRCYTLPGETPRAMELTRDSFRIWSDDAVSLNPSVADLHRVQTRQGA